MITAVVAIFPRPALPSPEDEGGLARHFISAKQIAGADTMLVQITKLAYRLRVMLATFKVAAEGDPYTPAIAGSVTAGNVGRGTCAGGL